MLLRELKVKIKSLSAEAAIIRLEERKSIGVARYWRKRDQLAKSNEASLEQVHSYNEHFRLHRHRTYDVRVEARAALLAYGFLRGVSLASIEETSAKRAAWDAVERIVKKFSRGTLGRTELEVWKEAAELPENMR